MPAPFLRVLVPLLVFLCTSGCAYRLAGGRGDDVAVTIETLTNDSLEPGVELVLAAALRRELGRSDGVRVVERATASGYRVAGRVAGVVVSGRTFTPGIRALEYTLTVQLELAVTGPLGQPIAIDPFAQRASEIYLASTDVQISRKNREEALRRVAVLLASRIRRELERAERRATRAASTSFDGERAT